MAIIAYAPSPCSGLPRSPANLDPLRLQSLVADNPDLTAFLERVLDPPPPPPEFDKLEQQRQARFQEQQRKARRGLETLQANEEALRNNTAPPALLHRLARTYFGDFMGFTPDSAVKRLQQLLTPHDHLLDAVQIGLRLTLQREDIPDADQILERRLESKMHYLCWPYLAGLAEAERAGTLKSSWWTGAHIRTALAFYFGYAHGDYEPSWYQHLIARHPAVVADVQIQLSSALLRKGVDTGNTNLWHLAFHRPHAAVAGHACLPLLRAFSRPRQEQPPRHARIPLARRASIRRPRRVRAVGCPQTFGREHASPPAWPLARSRLHYRDRDVRTFRGRVSLRRAATSAYAPLCQCSSARRSTTSFRWHKRALKLAAFLVHYVGRIVDPDELSEGFVTPAMEASTLVSRCIRVLAGDPGRQASAALAKLVGNPNVSRWRYSLSRAADDQRVYRRDHEYRHPSAAEAATTLQGGPPAGPADLAALVLDRLNNLSVRMRSGNTDDWKEFWNESGHSRPTDPKPEESCTQALVRGLGRIFPAHISVRPRGALSE